MIPVATCDAQPGYEALARVLDLAYAQAAYGKGKVRHANDKPFDQQPILNIGRKVGAGFTLGQALKKLEEAAGMIDRAEHGPAMSELLGAIVYAAATYVLEDEAFKRTDAPVELFDHSSTAAEASQTFARNWLDPHAVRSNVTGRTE